MSADNLPRRDTILGTRFCAQGYPYDTWPHVHAQIAFHKGAYGGAAILWNDPNDPGIQWIIRMFSRKTQWDFEPPRYVPDRRLQRTPDGRAQTMSVRVQVHTTDLDSEFYGWDKCETCEGGPGRTPRREIGRRSDTDCVVHGMLMIEKHAGHTARDFPFKIVLSQWRPLNNEVYVMSECAYRGVANSLYHQRADRWY